MKLSELVKMAGDGDPEILVYEEQAEYWSVRPTSGDGKAVLTDEGIVLVGSSVPSYDWQGRIPNPITREPGVLKVRPCQS